MTNFGDPYIVVEDGDYRRSRELYLTHRYEGRDLDMAYAEKTLQYVYDLGPPGPPGDDGGRRPRAAVV